MRYIPLGRREIKGLGEEELYEVAWMAELFRISDAHDRITIVLTARGTVVVEMAKGAHQVAGKKHLPFSRFRRTRRADPPQASREYPAAEVVASLHRRTLTLRLGKRSIRLRGVDPAAAREFIESLHRLSAGN